MKKNFVLLMVALVVVMSVAALAWAVPSGRTLSFTDSPMGAVNFDGKIHADAGKVCADCHKAGMFQAMKKGSVDIKMSEIYAGKQCGACHNGTETFAATGNCGKCHKK